MISNNASEISYDLISQTDANEKKNIISKSKIQIKVTEFEQTVKSKTKEYFKNMIDYVLTDDDIFKAKLQNKTIIKVPIFICDCRCNTVCGKCGIANVINYGDLCEQCYRNNLFFGLLCTFGISKKFGPNIKNYENASPAKLEFSNTYNKAQNKGSLFDNDTINKFIWTVGKYSLPYKNNYYVKENIFNKYQSAPYNLSKDLFVKKYDDNLFNVINKNYGDKAGSFYYNLLLELINTDMKNKLNDMDVSLEHTNKNFSIGFVSTHAVIVYLKISI